MEGDHSYLPEILLFLLKFSLGLRYHIHSSVSVTETEFCT